MTTPISKILSRFKEISDALHDEGGYLTGSYLIKYDSETDEQYQKRTEIAWTGGELDLACSRFMGYISKKPAVRKNIDSPLIQPFINDCNWKGDSLDVFWQSFGYEAIARGTMLLLVDMPKVIPNSAQEQIKERAFPYLVSINPEDIYAYKIDKRGLFEHVEIKDLIDGEEVIRRWDKQIWSVRKGEETLDSGEHKLGICPVLAFTISGDFPSLGGFSKMAPIIKRLYNLRSELDEQLRRHTFPIFFAKFPIIEASMYVDPGTAAQNQLKIISQLQEAIKKLGGERGIVCPGDVGFVAPPAGPAETLQETITKLEDRLSIIGLEVDMSGERAAESGLALTIRFQMLNSALIKFARSMEDLERRMFDVVAKWLEADNKVETEWPKDYELADTQREISILQQMQASSMPEIAIKKQMKTVIASQFSNAEMDDMDELIQAVDEYKQENQNSDDQQNFT